MKVGEKIFYPMHGAGMIKGIEEKKIGEVFEKFYVIELPFEQNLHIFIKENDIDKFEFRKLVDEDTLDEVYDYLNKSEFPMPKNWVKRYKENTKRMKSLDIFDIAYVLKGLAIRNEKGKLSLKELFMLNLAKKILVSEFVMVSGFSKNKINKIIEYSMEH